MKTSSFFQATVCVITVLLTSCVSRSLSSTETIPPIEITSFPSALKMDGIDIEFSGYELDNNNLIIIICFDPPSEESWMFGDVDFKVENQKISGGWHHTDSETGRADGYDCERLAYPFDLTSAPTGEAELFIGRLQVPADFDKPDCSIAQKHLDEAKTGVMVTCDPTIIGPNAVFGISKKPMSMTYEDAGLIAMEAFSYTEAIQLAWTFSFRVEKP